MSQVAQIWPYFLRLFSVSGWWSLQRNQCSTQPLWMELRPVQPQHPVPAPSDLQGTISFQSPCTDLGCTAQSFSCFFFKNWKDLMCQTCSLIALSTFNSTKLASVQFRTVHALANKQSPSPPKPDRQGAQQVFKEFVTWWFCIIGFINWDDYSSVANYNINYSSFNSLLPAFFISTCFFLCLLNCFKTSNIIFSLFCNPL